MLQSRTAHPVNAAEVEPYRFYMPRKFVLYKDVHQTDPDQCVWCLPVYLFKLVQCAHVSMTPYGHHRKVLWSDITRAVYQCQELQNQHQVMLWRTPFPGCDTLEIKCWLSLHIWKQKAHSFYCHCVWLFISSRHWLDKLLPRLSMLSQT